MSGSRVREAFIALAFAALISFLYVKSAARDVADYELIGVGLKDLQQLDADLDASILRTRYTLSSSYDQVVALDQAVGELELQLVARARRLPGDHQLAAGLAMLLDRSSAHSAQLEIFKGQNAVLRNTLDYFPSACAHAEKELHDGAHTALWIRIADFGVDLMAFGLVPGDHERPALEARLDSLVPPGDLGPGARARIDEMTAQARAILAAKQDVDRALDALLTPDVRAEMSALTATVHIRLTEARVRADRYRLLLLLAALVLLGALLVALVLQARTASALALAHATVEEQNAVLEAKVVERTRSLEAALAARLQMEMELRQAQKLESVGRLASGVAHEINTPVQFVSDSVHFLRDATHDLTQVIEKLRVVRISVAEGAPSAEAANAAVAAEAAADLPYLLENMPKAFERTVDGLDRIATIVRSMKVFAHPDSKEMSTVDLNQAVESTLVIARNEYKYVAELDMDLGALPPVLCYAGDINQAVLNIVVNAAHAIADVVKDGAPLGRITVRTWREKERAVIAIGDTGSGIPESVRDRIFDPFFTTKEVGKGTGQGLAIARSVVVDKHKGELTFESEVGKGTTFYLRIPIAPVVDDVEARSELMTAA